MNVGLISVVIPLFNQEKHIRETIDSALAQTYQDIEVIVVDDGSTDSSAAVVNNYQDKRLRYLYQPNSGLPSVARNQGLKLATGDWVAFLDHDDIWLPDKLAKQVAVLKDHPDIKIVSSNMEYFGDTPLAGRPMCYFRQKSLNIYEEMMEGNRLLTSTVLANKAVLLHFGGFNEARDLLAIEDYDLWLRISKEKHIFVMPEVLARYRVYARSTSGGYLKELGRLENYFNKYIPKMVSTDHESHIAAKVRSKILYKYALEYLRCDNARFRTYLRSAAFSCRSYLLGLICIMLSILPTPVVLNVSNIYRVLKNKILKFILGQEAE